MGRPWITSDDSFIRENYPTRGGKWCAEQLDRDQSTTRCRAKKLGVKLLYKNLTHIKTTKKQQMQMVELYNQGVSGPDIAAKMDVKPDCVYKTLHKQGVDVDRTGTRNRRWSDAEESEMVRLYLGGEDTIALSRRYGTSQSAICLVLSRNGVGMRPAAWGGGPRLSFTDKLGRKFKMRSTWELGMASWLDEQGMSWDYELVTYEVEVDDRPKRYTPDFWIYDGADTTVVDVKGVESPEQMKKIKALQESRPDLNLQIWDYWELKRRGVLADGRSDRVCS